jgi:hypothetical protein
MVGFMNNENKFVLVGNIVAFKEEFLEEDWYLDICVYSYPGGVGSVSVIDGLVSMVCPD